MSYQTSFSTTIGDGPNLDAFSRLRVSEPTTLFDAQFTYGLQPLLYEQTTSGSGAAITYDATNARAQLSLTATSNGLAYMSTFEHFRYQPGKGHLVFITFTLGAAAANSESWVGYRDADIGHGIYLSQNTDGNLYMNIDTSTSASNESVVQSSWNLDKLNGTGKSGITLDITKTQILVIDFQALYVGRVRVGFDIGGEIIYVHEFNHANLIAFPYILTANLPVSVGVRAVGGTTTKTIFFQCCSVISEGGVDETVGYEFSTPDTSVTAGNGTRTHLITVRPKATFNSITNRVKMATIRLDILVTGNNPIYWELVLGQGFSVAPTYADINTTYSAFEYGTGGTLTGSPAIVIDSGYVPASASQKGVFSTKITDRYPITLDSTGTVRSLGTLSLLVRGVGSSSACRASLKHKEIR